MDYDPSFGQPLTIAASTTVVSAGQSLTIAVHYADGRLYSGSLDHDQLFVPLGVTDLSTCIARNGPWETFFVNAGQLVVNVDHAPVQGGKLAEGMYIVRVRPPDSNGPYSNQIAYVIDRAARTVTEQTSNNSGNYIVPQPVPGAYTVFRDNTATGQLNGYTKIEFEAGPCNNGGTIQRFTKTLSTAYWGASDNAADPSIAVLRWCIGASPTSPQNFKALNGVLSHFDRTATAASSLAAARYAEDGAGALGRLGANPTTATYAGPSPLFYTLAPVQLFPEQLSNSFTPIIDRLMRYDTAGQTLDTWHVEVRASQLDGLYEVRYVEWALAIANLSIGGPFRAAPSATAKDWGLVFRWSVLEDWDWNADGTLNRLTQSGNSKSHFTIGPDDLPPDCWRTPDGSNKPFRHILTPLRSYVPDRRASLLRTVARTFPGWGVERITARVAEQFRGLAFAPLHIGFADAAGADNTALTITSDMPWTLLVQTADDTPYDGFVQVRGDDGSGEVWTDQHNYPIYVHNGQVELLPTALGLKDGSTITFAMRQQLLNAQIAADLPLTNRAQPTEDAMPFSNQIQLTVADSF